jgi:hypothetical protein
MRRLLVKLFAVATMCALSPAFALVCKAQDCQTECCQKPQVDLQITSFGPPDKIGHFRLPALQVNAALLYDLRSTNFCPVILCHGSCSWRRDAANNFKAPCALRGFDHLVEAHSAGCCGD